MSPQPVCRPCLGGLLLLRASVAGVFMAALPSIAAGRSDYWQAWAVAGLFFASTLLTNLYFLVVDPAFLARRLKTRETDKELRVLRGLMSLLFIPGLIIAGLDVRHGWSDLPPASAAIGDGSMIVGFLITFFVFQSNRFAGATVGVEAEQVIQTGGLYRFVRHPMYLGTVLVLLGMPLALGSLFAYAAFLPMAAIVIPRLGREERILAKDLPGYTAYQSRVRWRLLPFIF